MKFRLHLKSFVEVEADSPEQAKRELEASQEWIKDMVEITNRPPNGLANILLANTTVESVEQTDEK